jgi:hypothetical protein
VEERVRRWAEDVKHDVDTPDLWAELQREREILTGGRYEDVENTPFTSDEQAEIAEQLRQIKEFVKKTYSLPEAQILSLRGEARRHRSGRWSYRPEGLAALILRSDVYCDRLGSPPPEAVQHILAMALHALAHLFGGGGRPPQLPPLK